MVLKERLTTVAFVLNHVKPIVYNGEMEVIGRNFKKRLDRVRLDLGKVGTMRKMYTMRE